MLEVCEDTAEIDSPLLDLVDAILPDLITLANVLFFFFGITALA